MEWRRRSGKRSSTGPRWDGGVSSGMGACHANAAPMGFSPDACAQTRPQSFHVRLPAALHGHVPSGAAGTRMPGCVPNRPRGCTQPRLQLPQAHGGSPCCGDIPRRTPTRQGPWRNPTLDSCSTVSALSFPLSLLPPPHRAHIKQTSQRLHQDPHNRVTAFPCSLALKCKQAHPRAWSAGQSPPRAAAPSCAQLPPVPHPQRARGLQRGRPR